MQDTEVTLQISDVALRFVFFYLHVSILIISFSRETGLWLPHQHILPPVSRFPSKFYFFLGPFGWLSFFLSGAEIFVGYCLAVFETFLGFEKRRARLNIDCRTSSRALQAASVCSGTASYSITPNSTRAFRKKLSSRELFLASILKIESKAWRNGGL